MGREYDQIYPPQWYTMSPLGASWQNAMLAYFQVCATVTAESEVSFLSELLTFASDFRT